MKNRHGISDDMRSPLIGILQWMRLTFLVVLVSSAIGEYSETPLFLSNWLMAFFLLQSFSFYEHVIVENQVCGY